VTSASEQPPETWRLAAFALPAMLSALVHGPVAGIAPTLYATHFGLSLSAIGAAMLFARVFDAVSDPAIGYLSDRTRSPLGRRKPWLIASGILTMISAWFLFSPPAHPSLAYFFIWYVAVYFAWTLVEIPHVAWGAEITRDYQQRSRVFTFRIFAQFCGGVAFFLLPLLPIFTSHAVTPETLRFLAKVVLVATPVAMGAAIFFGPPSLAGDEREGRHRLRDLLTLVRGNRPLWIYLSGFLLAGLAEGMFGALTFLYFTVYFGVGESIALLFLLLYGSSLVIMPLVPWIASRFGKHRVWAGNNVVGAMIFMSILAVPKAHALLPLMLLIVPIGFSNALSHIIAPSLLGDVIDYDTLKTGKRRAATYTALYALVLKFNAAVGGAAAFFLLSLFGFNAKLGAVNGPQAMLGLKMAYVIIPSLIYVCSAICIWFFPIDRRRQGLIARRLALRDARARRAVEDEPSSTDEALALAAARG
jgi:GPH family glycoside/pentoside/hexuronide:cation symporter